MNTRKFLSVVLSLVMILSALPLTAVNSFAVTSGKIEYEILDDGTLEITGYLGKSDTSVEIPSVINKRTVTSISWNTFAECTELVNIVLPDTLNHIADGAFDDTAYYQNSANWENGVLYISNCLIAAKQPFWSDTANKYVTDLPLNYTVKSGTIAIADNAFCGCYYLNSVVIPNSVNAIGDSTFYSCTALEAVSLSNITTSIGSKAFYNCESLTEIIIPEGVTEIGSYAFSGCSSLTEITIPKSVEEIGYNALGYGCADDFTIYGYTNSEAERYANENEINFISLGVCCAHLNTELRNEKTATCTEDGYTVDFYCKDCEELITEGEIIHATGHIDDNDDNVCDICSTVLGYISGRESVCVVTDKPENLKIGDAITINLNVEKLSGLEAYISYDTDVFELVDVYDEMLFLLETNEDYGQVIFAGASNDIKSGTVLTITFEYKGGSGDISLEILDAIDADGNTVCDILGKLNVISIVCEHKNTEIIGKVNPTCTEDGYTGNLYCKDCGVLITEGKIIPATGHQHTELRNEKAATCTVAGYTGDLYCKDCGELITEGEIILATGHQHTELRNEKAATCTAEGYTGDLYCKDCGVLITKGEAIAKLEHTVVIDEAKEPTETENGLTEGSHCSVCGEVIVEQEEIPALGRETLTNDDESVSVENEDGSSFDPSVILVVKPIEPTLDEQVANDNNIAQYVAFDITLQKNEAIIQPDGNVKVYIDIPEGYDPARCVIYCLDENGQLTDMHATVEDGKLVYTTNHFSVYIVAEIEAQADIMLGDVSGDGKVTIADAKWVLQSVAKTRDLDETQTAAADLNGDGKVTIADAKWILQVVAGTRVL